jgi:hypothetical protein
MLSGPYSLFPVTDLGTRFLPNFLSSLSHPFFIPPEGCNPAPKH